jgi:galactose oxidase
MAGCPVAPMLTADEQGIYRQDNHGWLFNWKKSTIFQAGPAKNMNWYTMTGTGGHASAGVRGTDNDAMSGNAAMYDAVAGKILTTGGGPNYVGSTGTTNANVITLGDVNKTALVTRVTSMSYARIFHNSVVLPNGQVFVVGGQTVANAFYDTNAVLTPEMYSPSTKKFTKLTSNTIPRNYHSTALLLTDATVISCGGGMCGSCSTNHFDCQIYTPPYLLNTDGSLKSRPRINKISSTSNLAGATIYVTTGAPVTSFAMIRFGSVTHTVNTDQRRIPITPTLISPAYYKITLGPADVGVVTPGYWMLFCIDSAGVPSLAKTILIKAK